MGVAGLIFESRPQIFKINITFEDVQMILVWFFYISTGFKFTKNYLESDLQLVESSLSQVNGLFNVKLSKKTFFSNEFFDPMPLIV